ncbi:MAG: tRNA uracil 4-sulfurtransferase ThiI [Erysipelotrichaceae bacterium]
MAEIKTDRILVRFGELSNKGKNRNLFVRQLIQNLKYQLSNYPDIRYRNQFDRIMIELNGADSEDVLERARHVFGIRSLSPVVVTSMDFDLINEACLELMKQEKVGTFKVDTNRKDKTLNFKSNDLNLSVAKTILSQTDHKVDVHNPDIRIRIDVDAEKASIAVKTVLGAQGFPIGVGGKALLLLSGGIDSPVAGYYTMRRGVEIECIHFAAPPYTTIQALDKVKQLAEKLSVYQPRIKLHVVPFTEIQLEIYKKAHPAYTVVLMRRAMMKIAERVMHENKMLALVSGESLGQVASQTLQSMTSIQDAMNGLIIRPLLTFDKNDIIDVAKKINTYETSILPYEDCCTIFSVTNPITKPKLKIVLLEEAKCELDELIETAFNSIESTEIRYHQETYL